MKKVFILIEFLNYNVDIISLIPALFGAILSLYNFYKMSRPANIFPTEIVNYGLVSSSYEKSFKMVFPLVFHNDGAKKGIIREIRIGFKNNGSLKYLDDMFKVRLHELSDDIAQLCDWNKFIEHGYRIIQPTYPISILSDSSVETNFIATCYYEDEVIPLDSNSECIVEVFYGKNKVNTLLMPFYLAEEDIPDDRLVWFPLKRNIKE